MLCADLMFGSRLLEMLGGGADREVLMVRGPAEVARLDPPADVLVVDLTADPESGASALESLRASGDLRGARSLAFYSHVEVETRRRAEAADFDMVVPRSRMAREGGALVDRLLRPIA